MRADGSLEIRFLRASRLEEIQRPDRARDARGRRRGLRVAQGPLRLPAHRSRTAKKRHRREREARAPHHAEALACRKGRDPKTPHPEEGRAGRPSVEPGRVRFRRGRAQRASGGRHRMHARERRAALPRGRDRRLLPQVRGLVDVRVHRREGRDRRDRAGGWQGGPARRRRPRLHDGQGAQDASRSLRRCLDSHGVAQSASRPGTPPNNAVAKSFSETLKGESVEGRSYGARGEAKRGIFKCIEPYRNRALCIPPWAACLRWNTSGNTLGGP